MAEVKWIKLNVGMFDGNSFKRIKKAKIGGESFRDKLTAVWFELMDFAGKCNAGGQLIESPEIPFSNIEDIAVLIDREPEELNLCMQYYISNNMISVIDDIYMLTNWSKYQNEDGLEKIREQNRIRQQRWYEKQKALPNVIPNVSITQPNATDIDIEIEKEIEIETEKEVEKIKKKSNKKPAVYYPADEALNQTFLDYIDARKKMKKPMTEKAIELAMRELDKLAGNDNELAIKILNQSIFRGWMGLFPLKDEKQPNNTSSDYVDMWRNA